MEILVKTTLLYGRLVGPSDKYIAPEPGPTHFDTRCSYIQLGEFLLKHGNLIDTKTDPFPLIEVGVISGGSILRYYAWRDALVIQAYNALWRSEVHQISVAGKKSPDELECLLKELKENAGSFDITYYASHWKKREDMMLIIEKFDKKKILEKILPNLWTH